ncbi:hypothetical protein EPN95_03255 [Patescibacteria group bacterium]|nr:MAG: hypothetical protein EPN95_03255 [Patescibacteria group bacterium]
MSESDAEKPVVNATVLQNDGEHTIMQVELSGRNNRVVNRLSKTTFNVIKGEGSIEVAGVVFGLEEGLGVVVPAGVAYQDEGNMTMIETSTPPLNPASVTEVLPFRVITPTVGDMILSRPHSRDSYLVTEVEPDGSSVLAFPLNETGDRMKSGAFGGGTIQVGAIDAELGTKSWLETTEIMARSWPYNGELDEKRLKAIRREFFKESEPVELWSTSIALSVPYAEFERVVSQAAKADGQRYTGFITKDAGGNVTSFTRTRYPRQKYGIASIEACENGMIALAAKLGSAMRPDKQKDGFRVVLGLREGYDDNAPVHLTDEIQTALPGATVSSAEIFALRHTQGGPSLYTEPAAVITGPAQMIDEVYYLADTLLQERFAVEDFDLGVARMIEPRFCTEPDID